MPQGISDNSDSIAHSDEGVPFYLSIQSEQPDSVQFNPIKVGSLPSRDIVRPKLDGIERTSDTHSLFGFLLLFTLALGYAWSYWKYPQHVNRLILALFNQRVIHDDAQDETTFSLVSTSVLVLSGLILQAYVVHNAILLLGAGESTLRDIQQGVAVALLTMGFGLWLVVKVVTALLVGGVVKQAALLREYVNTTLVTSQSTGLLLFPLAIAVEFFELPPLFVAGEPESYTVVFVILGIALWGIIYLQKIIKTLVLGTFSYSVPPVYNILYLCGLEILPLLLAAKWLSGYWELQG